MSARPEAHAPEALRRCLDRLGELRGRQARHNAPPMLADVKNWQAGRLARTYADLAANARYAKATGFFLDDLYGAKDFSGRDQAVLRIYPVLVRTLPRGAVHTAALAVELEALSEELDQRLAACVEPGPVNAENYARAYRRAGTRDERVRQIELIGQVGCQLDGLVTRPIVYATLKLMRRPAKLAGLDDLQLFLERGFEAFRHMRGANDFLATISGRETAILNRLFSGHPSPFST